MWCQCVNKFCFQLYYYDDDATYGENTEVILKGDELLFMMCLDDLLHNFEWQHIETCTNSTIILSSKCTSKKIACTSFNYIVKGLYIVLV